ncbi:carboxypeptidase regulatory-like domain-containing protein [Natrarchaeobius chitinivorans]|uniref:PEGA domain-containing protein n=1 Tax=Natrarchaeobius chitinivorans TaxID=1679083 RepID=A0A3N6M3V3_NATCH|nr:carboxypeptidase regulatory-like domain-containing protein [Natrarchaeobius chitinivorans]RQG90590.1 PEGA domain-containing protein [Natrarchaeobius chitinivorans]
MRRDRRSLLTGAGFAGVSLLGATAIGSAAATADGGERRVAGTVSHFGEPVEEATVSLEGNEDTTGEDGRFELRTDAGEALLEVEADGYRSWSSRIALGEDETVTVDVTLDRTWSDETGELQVYATEVGGGSTIPCHVTVYGDEEYYADAPNGAIPDYDNWQRGFRVSEGWWEVRVTDVAGYDDGYQEVYVEAGESELAWVELEEGDRTIPSTGRVAGRVVDQRDEAVSGATLRIGGEPISVAPDGAFEADLEHGRHPLVAEADGYRPRRGTVTVRFGRETELVVVLENDVK